MEAYAAERRATSRDPADHIQPDRRVAVQRRIGAADNGRWGKRGDEQEHATRSLPALKNEQEVAVRRVACLSDVEASVPLALQSGRMFFSDVPRNQVDATGMGVLRALAAQGEEAVATQEALASWCPGVSQRTVHALLRRELLEPASGGYRFQVELIRRWFAQSEAIQCTVPHYGHRYGRAVANADRAHASRRRPRHHPLVRLCATTEERNTSDVIRGAGRL